MQEKALHGGVWRRGENRSVRGEGWARPEAGAHPGTSEVVKTPGDESWSQERERAPTGETEQSWASRLRNAGAGLPQDRREGWAGEA